MDDIKSLRENLGLSQRDIALLLNKNRSSLAMAECGKRSKENLLSEFAVFSDQIQGYRAQVLQSISLNSSKLLMEKKIKESRVKLNELKWQEELVTEKLDQLLNCVTFCRLLNEQGLTDNETLLLQWKVSERKALMMYENKSARLIQIKTSIATVQAVLDHCTEMQKNLK